MCPLVLFDCFFIVVQIIFYYISIFWNFVGLILHFVCEHCKNILRRGGCGYVSAAWATCWLALLLMLHASALLFHCVLFITVCLCVCVCAVCPSIEKVIYIAFELFMARFTFPVCYEIICWAWLKTHCMIYWNFFNWSPMYWWNDPGFEKCNEVNICI